MTSSFRAAKIYILVLLPLCCLALAHSAYAATYYVDATGGNDSNDGLTTDTAWKTVAKVNGVACGAGIGQVSPGDNVLFKRGETWREKLVVPCSGTSGNPIHFGAYGSGQKPTLIGSNEDDGTGWTGPDGNGHYHKSYPTQPYWLMRDGVVLTATGTLGSLAADAWIYSAGNIYLGGSPAGHIFEVAQRAGAETNNQDFVQITDLAIRYFQGSSLGGGASGGGIDIANLSDHITIEANDIQYGASHGIAVRGASHVTVASNTVDFIETRQADTSGDGITIAYYVPTETAPTDIIVDSNVIGSGPDSIDRQGIAVVAGQRIEIRHNIIQSGHWGIDLEPNVAPPLFGVLDADVYGNTIEKSGNTRGYSYNGGIAASGYLSSHVKIYDNQIILDDSYLSRGIWVRDFGGTGSELFGNIIRYAWTGIDVGSNATPTATWLINGNQLSGGATNRLYGINLSRTQPVDVVINNNVIDGYDNAIWNNTTSGVNTALVYSNTILNYGQNGLYVGNCDCHTYTVENNIFSGTPAVKHIRFGPGVAAAVDNNLYKSDGSYFVWNGIPFASFSAWQATSSETEGVVADPHFVDILSNVALRHDSPAIDAGTTTALHTSTSTDYLGNPIYGTPDIGAIEYQPPYVIGTHDVPATGAIRLYADGKFRERVASTTAATSDLTVTPQGGWGSGDYREYMDIEIDTWTATSMAWTATSSIATTTVFTLGGLTPNGWYTVQLDAATSSSIGGATCTSSVCQANGSGVLAFTYSGSWSTHSFEVTPGSNPNPTSGGGVCLNCGSGSSRGGSSSSGITTTPSGTSSAETTGSGSAPSAATSTPFRCAETAPVTDGLSGAGLVNLLVSLSIIPSGKAKTACDALTSAAAAPSAPAPAVSSSFRFSVPLAKGMRSGEVRRLQQFLNTHGFVLASGTELGAPGHETNLFGLLTEDAVKRFQAAYAAEILVPVGLTAPSGYFGPSSIRKANALLSGA